MPLRKITSRFRTIPAIDLLGGKVVRLYQGDYSRSTVYYDDPALPAKNFIEAGADLIHLVDLDAARGGDRNINRDAIARVIEIAADRAVVQLGGGIRSIEDLESCFELGVGRCIMGTAALTDFDFLSTALQRLGAERIIIAVDVRDGRLHLSGWEKSEKIELEQLLPELERRGVQEIIFTDISRDGTLAGPGDLLYQYIATCNLRFILSGGVASLEDLYRVAATRPEQLVGIIVGRALYEGRFDLKKALLYK